jgi:hypothetical protein
VSAVNWFNIERHGSMRVFCTPCSIERRHSGCLSDFTGPQCRCEECYGDDKPPLHTPTDGNPFLATTYGQPDAALADTEETP